MKILVTGGTGFLGRHIVWRLAELGHAVTFTGRQQSAADEVIKLSSAAVTFLALEHGEKNSQDLLVEVAQGMDAIIHSAALSSPWGSKSDFYKANVLSAQEVIVACQQNSIKRLVHISTPSLYFNFCDRLNIKESDALPSPVNSYAATKARAECLVKSANIPETVILRPRALFGPWDNTLMPRLLRVIERGAIPLMRGGNAQLDITYVENVVDAVVLSLTKSLPGSCNIYNVSNGEPYHIQDLLAQLAQHFSLPLRTKKVPWPLVFTVAKLMEYWASLWNTKEPPLTCYGVGVLAYSQTLDISAISKELGYQPRISIEEGLRRHARWFAEQNKMSGRSI